MSDTMEPETEVAGAPERPWHGSDDPWGSFHDWVKAEFAKLRSELPKKVEAPVVTAAGLAAAAEAVQKNPVVSPQPVVAARSPDEPPVLAPMEHIEAPVIVDAPAAGV